MRLTDEEISNLYNCTRKAGFEKPRDFIAFMTQKRSIAEQKELIYKAMAYDRMTIALSELATKCNKFDEYFTMRRKLNEAEQMGRLLLGYEIVKGVRKLWDVYK